jgi:UDP-glucose 4-epimerase
MKLAGKKIVVTGGAGFLGSHVVALLLKLNNHVIVLDNFYSSNKRRIDILKDHPNLTIINGDITKKEDAERSFDKANVIIHLAVLGLRESIKNPKAVTRVVVEGTVNCLEAAREKNVELFVNCSSSEAYGTAHYVPMDEQHPMNPETPYAAAKVAQDMAVYSFGRTYNLPWVTVRPFNMFGPHSHWSGSRGELIPKLIVRAMNKEILPIFGDGQQTRDFIYVKDVAEAIVNIAENPNSWGKSINVCSGSETSIYKVAECICKLLNLDPEVYIKKFPPRPGEVRRHLGSNLLFRQLFERSCLKTNFEDGLTETVRWFRSLPFKPAELLSEEKLFNWK